MHTDIQPSTYFDASALRLFFFGTTIEAASVRNCATNHNFTSNSEHANVCHLRANGRLAKAALDYFHRLGTTLLSGNRYQLVLLSSALPTVTNSGYSTKILELGHSIRQMLTRIVT